MRAHLEADIYETIFRESLKDFRILDDGKVCGFCDSAEVERLLDRLKSHGFVFSVRRSRNSKPCADPTQCNKSFYFQLLRGNVHVYYFGPPFTVESTCKRECVLGPKYYKKQAVATAHHLEDHVNPCMKRMLVMDTKKSDCPAVLETKVVSIYPDYAISSLDKHWETKAKVTWLPLLNGDIQ